MIPTSPRFSFILGSGLALPLLTGALEAADFTAEQWRVAEIPLTSAIAYPDPFQDVEVTATFTGPGGQIITRPAFWDGGNTWRVRFAPTATGEWTMTTTCTDAGNSGLQGITRSVQCDAYTGTLPLYQRGFVKVAPSGRYFTYADGTPFFYLGDTHWIFIHERFSTSNVPGVPSQFKYTVDKRVDQGFTVFQSESIHVPHGEGAHDDPSEEPHADFTDGFTAADLPGLENMDRKFAYVADKGLLHAHAGITWAQDPANPVFTEDYMGRLGRYWAARFGAYPVLWTVAQEIDPYMYGAFNATTIQRWFAGAQGMTEHDGYGHPLGAHMENMGSIASDPRRSTWSAKPYHKWWPVQMQGDLSGHTGPRNFYNSTPAKPVVLYEGPYDHFWTDTKGARGAGYKAFQWGMCGYGYGAAGVWNDIYALGDYGTAYQMPARYMDWHTGANLPAGQQMTYLRNFYTSLEWWKLVPRFDDAAWSAFVEPARSLLSSDGDKTFVVYFFGSGTTTGTLRGMAATTYEASWFDPRTGATTKIGGVTPVNGQWNLPARPDAEDWVLLVKQAPATVMPSPAAGANASASQKTVSWTTPGMPSNLSYEVRFGDATRYDITRPHSNLYLITPPGGTTATTWPLPSSLVPGTNYYWMLSVTDPATSSTTDYTFYFTTVGGAATVPVPNGSFEIPGQLEGQNWARVSPAWNPGVVANGYQQNNLNSPASAHMSATSANGGNWFALINANVGKISQSLNTMVSVGDTVSVTFQGGRGRTGVSTAAGGTFNASLVVGTTKYTIPVNTSLQANNAWQPYTITQTVTNGGPLGIEFSAVSGDPWLDNIGAVTITPAPVYSVTLDGPAEGQRYLSGSEVTATATVANGTGPYTVSYELSRDGGAWTDAGSSSAAPYTANFGALANGSYQLRATVTDRGAANATLTSMQRSFIVSPVRLIPVENGSFETTGTLTTNSWARIAPGWNPGTTAAAGYQQNSAADTNSRHLSHTSPGGGVWFALMNANTISITRDLGSTVEAGDTLAMNFYAGRGSAGLSTAPGGVFKAEFIVGTTVYDMVVDTTTQGYDTWQLHTLAKTIENGGNLSIRFTAVSGDPWLDNISAVSVTKAGSGASYDAWISGQEGVAMEDRGFSGDADKDGVANGLVWLLGGDSVLSGGLQLAPTGVANPDGTLTLTFNCLGPASRGPATVAVQYSDDNQAWQTAAVPDISSTVNGVEFTVEGTDLLHVTAKIPPVHNGDPRLFGRVTAAMPE
ncbi:DUF4038 domain-containing protein [Luteolibacter flavescens]|uniref:DUF4038 domain-containing protein n=1 Tax=Luteolibacter flavescens TaxID=1859460 RepID=A0ABT3FSD7_9BACT|nr:DUF4038 domain-containing protein [Luteolibacter flavescens]MCW1886496.1 DUF4038 domain-containing protein [Luteolibacter flavescens]